MPTPTAAELCVKYNPLTGACCYPNDNDTNLAIVYAMCAGGSGGGGGPVLPEFDREFLTGFVQDSIGTIHYYFRTYNEETGVMGAITYFTSADMATPSVPLGATLPVSLENLAIPLAGGQIIAVAGAVVSFTVPAGARGAIAQVQQTSGPANAEFRFFADGRTPTATSGLIGLDLSEIIIGRVGTLQTAGPLELSQFRGIASAGATFDLVVNYYR